MSFLAGVPGKLKTVLDRLTAARAAFLDYIDTLNTRWDATSKTDFGTLVTNVATLITRLTATRAANLDNVGYYYTQRFDSLSMTGATLDQAIDAVVLAKSEVRVEQSVETSAPTTTMGWDGEHWTLTMDQRPFHVRARFTSTTNVRIERGNTGSPAVTLKCNITVKEWKTS